MTAHAGTSAGDIAAVGEAATAGAAAAAGEACPVDVPTVDVPAVGRAPGGAPSPGRGPDESARGLDGAAAVSPVADEADAPARGAHRVALTYCTQCRWLTRAAWMAQEILTTFPEETEVALVPGRGGVFQVRIDDALVWDRRRDGGFPEITTLKRLVRDVVAPGRALGHSEKVRVPAQEP